jgi:hypothetical protein
MYCRCGRQKSFTPARRLDGGRYDFNYHYWVCGSCKLPARLVFEGITHMNVLKSATALLSYDGHADGRGMLTWGMADGTKVRTMVYKAYLRKVDMDQGRNILVELWHRLDRLIDEIRAPQEGLHVDYNKAQANCLADTLALIMSPFYEDSTAVLRESMKRWEARQENREYESPGLAEAIWDPDTRFDGTPYSADSEAKARKNGALPTPVKFDEQKINFIKHSLANGILTADKLADMFACSIEAIREANDS